MCSLSPLAFSHVIPEITKEAPVAITRNRKKKTKIALDPAPSILTDPVPDMPPWSVPEPEQSSRLRDLRTLPHITLRNVWFLFLLRLFSFRKSFYCIFILQKRKMLSYTILHLYNITVQICYVLLYLVLKMSANTWAFVHACLPVTTDNFM